MQYGLNIENHNLIVDKAKSKNDGVFSFRGVDYRVKGNGVTHFAANGKILESCGRFVSQVGSYDCLRDNPKKILLGIK